MPGSDQRERPTGNSPSGSELRSGPFRSIFDSSGRCGDPNCFCANWLPEPLPPSTCDGLASVYKRRYDNFDLGVSREFCEMWGEIGLAHEAAVECREFHWPPIGRTYSWLPGFKVKDEAKTFDSAAFDQVIRAMYELERPRAWVYPPTQQDYQLSNFRWEIPATFTLAVTRNGVFTVDPVPPRMQTATAADFSNPSPRTYGISWSPEFALSE